MTKYVFKKEAAEILGVSQRTVDLWSRPVLRKDGTQVRPARLHRVPSLGSRVRFLRAEVEQLADPVHDDETTDEQ